MSGNQLEAAHIAGMQADREKLEIELAFWVASVKRYDGGEVIKIVGGQPVDRSMVRFWKKRIVEIRRQLSQATSTTDP